MKWFRLKNQKKVIYSLAIAKGKTEEEVSNTIIRLYGGKAFEGTTGEFWIDQIYLLQDAAKSGFLILKPFQ